MNEELNEIDLIPIGEWADAGIEALQVGWGCPLVNPIASISTGIGNTILGWINYFIPMSEMAGILVMWTMAIGMYYAASVVLRWLKVVS